MRKIGLCLGAGALAASLVSAVGLGAGTAAAAGGSYKIGYATTLSGPYSANGIGERKGFTAYIAYVNKHGGVHGKKIQVTALDDKATSTVAVANATQLISSGAIGITGGLLSNACNAQLPIATEHKVPLLCSAIGTTALVPVKPYAFTSRIAQTDEGLPELTFAKSLAKGPKKLAVIIFGSVASSGLENAIKKDVGSTGLTLVTAQNVTLGSTDLSAQEAAIEAAKPTVIIGSLYDPLAVSFIRALQAHGMGTVPFVDYDGASLSGSMVPLKDKNFYVVSSMSLTGQGAQKGLKQYRQATSAATVQPTSAFVNVGYTEGQEIVAGLDKCGRACPGAKLATALNKIDVNTGGLTAGPEKFSSKSHAALHEVNIYHWTTSKNAVVAAP